MKQALINFEKQILLKSVFYVCFYIKKCMINIIEWFWRKVHEFKI